MSKKENRLLGNVENLFLVFKDYFIPFGTIAYLASFEFFIWLIIANSLLIENKNNLITPKKIFFKANKQVNLKTKFEN